jgi:hypothetical protein
MRQAEAPFRWSGGLTIGPEIALASLQHCQRGAKVPRYWEIRTLPAIGGYCFASGAARTCLQPGGICVSVIPGLGFGGSFGGFGWMIESLNQ